MTSTPHQPLHCAIVLSGGEGRRLQPFIRQLLGSDLPKQYVNFIGMRSMLEHTFDRVERAVAAERIFTVAAQSHMKYSEVQKQLGARPKHTVILQPQNKETGPGILLPLMHLIRQYPNSIVAVFPSDHFILEEDLFAAYLAQAYAVVEECPAKIVFLGVNPTDPECEYGYLLPDNCDSHSQFPAQKINAFIEKPDAHTAAKIIAHGALWNTMVLVFKPEVLLHSISLSAPRLHASFQRIFLHLGSRKEASIIEEAYEEMESINFSKDLIEKLDAHSRGQLSVIPMKGVFWSDWGSRERIISGLIKLHDRNHSLKKARRSNASGCFRSLAENPLEAIF